MKKLTFTIPKQLISQPIKIIDEPNKRSHLSPIASDNIPPINGITIFGYALKIIKKKIQIIVIYILIILDLKNLMVKQKL